MSYYACIITIIKLIINCSVLCMSFIGQVRTWVVPMYRQMDGLVAFNLGQ